MAPIQSAVQAFQTRFQARPETLVRAPGRVNLIGEHTDYNDGFVLPMAISQSMVIALRPRPDRQLRLFSLDFPQPAIFQLDEIRAGQEGWVEYVKGLAWAFQTSEHKLRGWEGVLASKIPVGAGLSSSAALEMSVARAFQAVSGWGWDGETAARLARKADQEFVGISAGIMDQMISALGQSGTAMLLDCRTLEKYFIPLPAGTAVVVLDTATRRGLVDSAYNERVSQCQVAARHFGVKALRDVSLEEFHARSAGLDPVILRRARHVITENGRTLEAVKAMENGDPARLGQLLDASHASLRDDYEVSSPALDTIVSIARRQPGCYGARLTGAGFGGCALALVDETQVNTFIKAVSSGYAQQTRLSPNLYCSEPANGAEELALPW